MGPIVLLMNGHIALWIAEKLVGEEKGKIAAFSAVLGMGLVGLKPMISSVENAAMGISYILGLYVLWRLWFKRKVFNV
jgi:hypothetical protein